MYKNFIPKFDTLTFFNNECEKEIIVELVDDKEDNPERDDVFEIVLFDAEPETAKISSKNKCMIHIVGELKHERRMHDTEKLPDFMHKADSVPWLMQFKYAVMLHPQIDKDGNIQDVSSLEAFLHFASIGWKVVFSITPPAKL